MPHNLVEFRRRVVDSGLLSSEELDEFVARLPPNQQPADGHQLARLLVQKKKLTAYQAQAIYQGKGRALTLGKYVILDKLGQGGMGIVFRAEQRPLKRVVALKVLSTSGRRVASSNWRFRREVRAAGLLQHPNIVTAYDADAAEGVEFLVMEYVDGVSLSQLVKQRGPLPIQMAINCTLQAAQGLEYAHSRGVVHRDVKPGNLLLDRAGTVKILDMGLARLEAQQATAADGESTETGEIMGTADFMAPEQAAHMSLSDARADIYSLGCTLWYLLTGREAYPGANRMEKLVGHWEHPIPSLRAARPESPPALEIALTRMLAKKPEDRPQTMGEVIAALQRCRTAEPPAPASPIPGPAEDRELINFLQALPELPSDRELRSRGRQEPGVQHGSSGPGGRLEKDARLSAATAEAATATHVSGPPASGRRVAAVAVIAAVAALLLIVSLVSLPGWWSSPPPAPPPASPPKREPPPQVGADWTALFNGADLTGWRPLGQATWTVEDERLIGRGSPGWLASETTDYGDFELSLEYRLAPGGDSGVYLRAMHEGDVTKFLELQLADDSHSNPPAPPDRRTGGLIELAAPQRPATTAPLRWHHLIARVQGTKVQVWLDKALITRADVGEAGLVRPSVHSRSSCIGLAAAEPWVEFREIRLRRLPRAE